MEQSNGVQQLLAIRTIVASLGETSSPPWWRTQFLTEAGLRATSRIFPRTAVTAAINSVSEAARRDHDTKVGVGRRYHLFRLPTESEEGLARTMAEQESQSEMRQLLQSGRDGLIKRLESLTGGSKLVGKEGPVALGSATRINKPETIAELAAYYLRAFTSNQKCYPYFEDQEGRA